MTRTNAKMAKHHAKWVKIHAVDANEFTERAARYTFWTAQERKLAAHFAALPPDEIAEPYTAPSPVGGDAQ